MKRKLPKKLLLAHIAFIVTIIIWSAAGPVIKCTLDYIAPFTFLFLRFLIISTLMIPYVIIELKRNPINPKDYLNLFILGILSQTSLSILFWGLKYTTALDSALIGILSSILTVYAGTYFFKDKISKNLKRGLILSSIGTLIVIMEPILNNTNHIPIERRVLGNLLVFIYGLYWISYMLISKISMGERSQTLIKKLKIINIKPMSRIYSPTLLVSLSFFVGLLTLIPLAVIESFGIFGSYSFNIFELETPGILGLMYMALLSSGVAYMLNQWALDNADLSDYAIYNYLNPVFTLPFAYILLKELPNIYMVIGGIVIGIGVLIAERKH